MEARAQQSLWSDGWVPSHSDEVAISAADVVLRPEDVSDLHSACMARATAQPKLWVVTKDEELAAYVRCLKAEYPSWNVTCIRHTDSVSSVPDDDKEDEWRYSDGAWAARRLQNVR
eukprot:3937192-Rhodomonas_salina.1